MVFHTFLWGCLWISMCGKIMIKYSKQECIPVGCVPPSAVAICWGSLPQCMLGYPPPRYGPPRPPGQTPQLPPWVWAWRPPRPDPPTSSLGVWVWAWKPAMHAGILPPPVDRNQQCMLGYHLPREQNHRHVNITLIQLRR